MNSEENAVTTAVIEDDTTSKKINRTGFKISQESFEQMKRPDRKKIYQKYLCDTPSKKYDDDKMFQFSRTTMAKLRKADNFLIILDTDEKGNDKKVIFDPHDKNDISKFMDIDEDYQEHAQVITSEDEVTIQIDHGTRKEKEARKLTLSPKTVKMMDELTDCLSNMEKSKVIDTIFSERVEELLDLKKAGKFHVEYRPTEVKRLF